MKLEPFDLEEAKKNPSRVRHQASGSAIPTEVLFPKYDLDHVILYWCDGDVRERILPTTGVYPIACLRLAPDPDKIHPWDAKLYFAELGQWELIPNFKTLPKAHRFLGKFVLNANGDLTNPENWHGMKRI